METTGKEGKKNPTADDIREISDKHIQDIPDADAVPDLPATGGKQFVNDGEKATGDGNGAEKKQNDLKP